MRALVPYFIVFLLGMGAMYLFQRSMALAQVPALGKAPPKKIELVIADQSTVRIQRVIDGDTVALENGLLVRYRGINAPESGHFIKDPSPMAIEATERNRVLVEGKTVRLQLGNPPMDAYGRLIARLTLVEPNAGTTDVEGALLKEGLAKILPLSLNEEEMQQFKELEAEAKKEKRGLWGIPDPFADGHGKEFQYCAAGNSKVFHHVNSATAHKISPQNFVGYKTLEDAVCSGRSLSTTSIKYVKKNGGTAHTDEPKDIPVEEP